MNNFVGSPSLAQSGGHAASPYSTYQKNTSITMPTMTFVFLDERSDSIDDGTFFTYVGNPHIIQNMPASYHGGAAGFSFADGHSEMHKWTSALLNKPAGTTITSDTSVGSDAAALNDSYWLCQHAVGLAGFP
jgi:prepilin-type processing-associated H-X9-DG protein